MTTEVPDVIRRAIEAQGKTSVDEVLERIDAGLEDPVEPPPPAARHSGVNCAFCEEPVNPAERGVMREIRGWDEPRRKGGTNHVRFRRETGRVMCPRCVVLKRADTDPAQATLDV